MPKSVDRSVLNKNILDCADGSTELNGICILLSRNENDLPVKLSYNDAVEKCHSIGKRLFEPKDEMLSQMVANVSNNKFQ